ncbi:hypothetical protein Tco_0352537 [Tanacetum coccineum]
MVINSPCLTDFKNWLVQSKQFCTTEEGLQAISATIDGHEQLITKASLRRHLKLDDAEGISSLSNEEIFEHLAHMGSKKTAWDQFSSNIATVIICLATSRRFNFSKFIFEAMVKNLDSPHIFFMIHLSMMFTHIEVLRVVCNNMI